MALAAETNFGPRRADTGVEPGPENALYQRSPDRFAVTHTGRDVFIDTDKRQTDGRSLHRTARLITARRQPNRSSCADTPSLGCPSRC